ncbi:MAG: N-6 DNA methylase [Deltaproteobacteria bacterium]|nr:N-6 DNA methylase [Deltaproteobacteria bacterium]
MGDTSVLRRYLHDIFNTGKRGDAREESYYETLSVLLREMAPSRERSKFHITTMPKSTEGGNPDFRVWDGKQHIVGYIEAKAPTVDHLDSIEDSEQLKRYRHTFPNLILTNFFEFRLYRNGERILKTFIARSFIAHTLKTMPSLENECEFQKLLEIFFSFSLPKAYTAKALAVELAKRTSFLRDEVIGKELYNGKSQRNFIHGFFEAFQKYLIRGLDREDFADLYSQTITYGLFAARMRAEGGFNRKLAYAHIPPTIGILRDVFRFISFEDPPPQMEWIIDDIAEVLSVADVNKLLQQYFHEGKGKDPIIHFYETFLSEYDPKTRERRGVYYTPEAVVTYIVRSLHHILKDRFNKSDGMASESVTVLDPASGTLTFLAETAKLAMNEFVRKYGEGHKEGFIKEHILKNYYAFELMMAPYAVGHLKMAFLLEELGYRLHDDDRFKLYLTNTLEMEELEQTSFPGMASLSQESHAAGRIKKEQPILAIMGNPPYSGHSANQGKWIDDLLKKGYAHENGIRDGGYYQVDGKPLGERNPKWLQDDYVKFIRFSQWKIDQAGIGVLGFVTNHSYLDNPTFRGMRRSLMSSFDELYVLDLHGNSLKKETCPDGSKDENVFDIRQGVAIALFIKTGNKDRARKIYHSDLWGLRGQKYGWLESHDLENTEWNEISPKSESYLFIPRDEKLYRQYEQWPKVTDIFPMNSVGIVTARDKLTIKYEPNDVWITVLNFSKMDVELARVAYQLGKDVRDWKVDLAQKDLLEGVPKRDKIVAMLYRPFDIRYTYYTGKTKGFHCMPRREIMRHMIEDNIGLILPKRVETQLPWTHVLCTNVIIDHVVVSLKTIDYLFPLYCFPDTENHNLFSAQDRAKDKQPNIDIGIFEKLSKNYPDAPTPEMIFYYIYAILYAETYREKYVEFLKMDFPRIPFTKDYELFGEMAEYGGHLADLHLMKSPDLDSPIAKFQGSGDDRVDKLHYDEKDNRVYINKSQYFENVPEKLWEYHIGGYQVCSKWLKDRKDRVLSLNDVKQYCKIVTAIEKTIKIQRSIDDVFRNIEKTL